MAVRLNKVSAGSRLNLGVSVLAAARAVDTRLVKGRLERFEVGSPGTELEFAL